jgi:rRNA maturation protein Nop10
MIKKDPETNVYTLQDKYEERETVSARPPKFSFPDRHGKYRRQTKKEVEE